MLNIHPPFGYRALKPLNRSDYVRFLEPGEVPAFARETQIMPLSYTEIIAAAWHYPVVFLHDETTGRYNTVAILGLSPNRNTFGDAAGWDKSAYVPAYVRRYPFCMTSVVIDGKTSPDLMVCVEAEHVSDASDTTAVKLFDDEDQPTSRWADIESFLKDYEADLSLNHAYTMRLKELDLFEPFTANIEKPDGTRSTLGGMSRVNEAKLAGLDDATVAELHRNGQLGRIYMHLFSLQRFHQLLEREAQQDAVAMRAKSSLQ